MNKLPKHFDFATREAYWQKFWEDENVFTFDAASKKKVYSIDTPPPTISGKLHVGHASSYTQGDMVARYHRMKGENVFYPFGTDDNGLPTQKLVEKEKKVRAIDLGRDKFVKLVLETLEKEFRPSYIAEFKRAGLSSDFTLSYSTIDDRSRRLGQWSFIELYKKDRAYQQDSPTMWCRACRTAISQVELEDEELDSTFNDIIFKVDGKDLVIATTRPELLPACVAVFYHPEDKRYQKFEGKKAKVPLFDFEVPIMADKRVDMEKGTGIVMNCTFGDQMDMEWQKAYKLPIKEAIGPDGKMTEIAGKYKRLSIPDAREKVIEDMKQTGLLKNQQKIKHTVNVHERCGTEIEFLKSKQWFIKYLDLKDKMLEWGNELKWFPEFMQNRYDNWVKGLQWDWCISRQIFYGIPFPVWYCKDCGEVILAEEKDLPVDPLKDKPPVDKCPKCGKSEFEGEADIINTWATSSLSPQVGDELAKERGLEKGVFPQNLRLQSHDIITFWVFNTVVKSQLHFKKNPFKDVLISGWVLDSKGKKMSKSKGNVVEPQKVFDEFGVDAFRYWAAGASPGTDHNFNQEEVRVGKKTVTKLWNVMKFASMHLEDFKPVGTTLGLSEGLESVDHWILSKLSLAIKNSTASFDKYNYTGSREATDKFFWSDFTDRYLEFVKYRLYGEDKVSKKTAQQIFYTVFLTVLKLYAPIIPYVTEEIYQTMFKKFEKTKSVHLLDWPKEFSQKSPEEFQEVLELVDEIKKYKSEQGLSMGKELESYKVKDLSLKDEDREFVKNVMRVRELK